MRVIAGKYRSRRLGSLPGLDLRPTADRLRETLFNVLTAANPSALEATLWLDLYAGTGAVGIEALSRGASMVYFVESSPQAAELISQNLETLGIEAGFQIIKNDAIQALRKLATGGIKADFIFLDPPYRMEAAYEKTMREVPNVLSPNGLVIAEHSKKFDPVEAIAPMARFRKLEQGDAALSFYRAT